MSEGKRAESATIATCVGCGGPAGEGATVAADGKGVLCRPCSYAGTVGDVRQAAADSAAMIDAVQPIREGPGPVRKAIGMAAFVAVLVSSFLVWTPIVAQGVESEHPYCMGPVNPDAPGLDECLGGLWRLRAALSAARPRLGAEPPESLKALGDIPDVCPGCGGAWVYEKDGEGGYRISCPHPEKHGLGAVYINHQYGPPQVKPAGESE